MDVLERLKHERYISVETYRRNGRAVRTPVWFVISDGLVIVVTRDQTGKFRRLRNDRRVRIAACSIRGHVREDGGDGDARGWASGTATILSERETADAVRMRDAKYGMMARLAKVLSRGKGRLSAFSIKID